MSTWVSSHHEDTLGLSNQRNRVRPRRKESDLVVDLKFLNHSQLHEHSQSGRYHGIDVQGEIVEGELIDAQLADEGNVSSLLCGCGRKDLGGEGEIGEQERMERSGDAVPFLDDTMKHGDMVIKTRRTYSEELKINEAGLLKDSTVVYSHTSLTNAAVHYGSATAFVLLSFKQKHVIPFSRVHAKAPMSPDFTLD